ncbi:MAG: hypothetical protein JNN18_15665 [Rubrivivax sp.]|jgi:hypothetical protein|nr:hypothetical protein [Rubrivivax sp.]
MSLFTMIALALFSLVVVLALRWAVRAALWQRPAQRSRARRYGPAPAWSYAGSGRGSRPDRPWTSGDLADPEDVADLVTSWADSHRSRSSDSALACSSTDRDSGGASCSADTGSSADLS